MPLTRTQKEDVVATVKEKFQRAIAAVFVDFRGLDVNTITDLRSKFREAGVEYAVVKNNLVRKALSDTPFGDHKDLDEHLNGPTAVAWSYDDPSAAAKIIKEFHQARKKDKLDELMHVKCAILEEEYLDAQQVRDQLANLPSKNELRSQLLAQLLAPMESLVRQLAAPGQNLAYVLDAFRRKSEEGA